MKIYIADFIATQNANKKQIPMVSWIGQIDEFPWSTWSWCAITNAQKDFIVWFCESPILWPVNRVKERESATELCMQLLSRQKLVASLEPLCASLCNIDVRANYKHNVSNVWYIFSAVPASMLWWHTGTHIGRRTKTKPIHLFLPVSSDFAVCPFSLHIYYIYSLNLIIIFWKNQLWARGIEMKSPQN